MQDVFGFISNLFGGDKDKPPPAHDEHQAAPPVTNSVTGSIAGVGKAVGTVLDFINPLTPIKHLVEPLVQKGVDKYHEYEKHHEQVKAAETSRDQLHDKIDKLSLPKEQKDRILARAKGLSGDDLVKEMATLDHALGGKNADRALAAYAEVDEMVSKNPDAAKRINSDMMGMLVTGVANSRTDSDRGQAGILGARQARDGAQALINMNDAEFAKTQQLLDHAGKDEAGKLKADADPAAEQALILKAVAARRDKFKHLPNEVDPSGASSPAWRASQDIEDFAKTIRGMKRDELIQSTTLLDIDDKNTSTTDPDNNKKKDDKVDNDGLFQRFTMSCGPTTSQMVRGEVDPVYALKLRQNHFNDNDPNSEFAQEQKKVLEANSGSAVNRLGENARTESYAELDKLKASKEIKGDEYAAAAQLLAGGQTLSFEDSKKAQHAIEIMRKKGDGHPSDAELAAIQQDAGKAHTGMVLNPALNTIAGDAAHINYTTNASAAGGISNTQMGNVDKLLQDGQQVPIRIGAGTTGHFMMVSDVRGEPGKGRQYLVSDPLSGATRWVPEADFQSGKFTNNDGKNGFNIFTGTVTHLYADSNQTI